MGMRMNFADFSAQVMAYVDHLDAHPHLVDSVAESEMAHYRDRRFGVLAFDHTNGHMPMLASWARTLASTAGVKVRTGEGHVTLMGTLADGTGIDVRTVLSSEDVDLLAANNAYKVGETFPVDLLLRLTSPVAAEAVSR